MEEVSGIIISSIKYKENDALISILNEKGVFTYKARALYSKNSHLAYLLSILNEVKLETYKGGQKYSSIRDGTIVNRFFQPQINDGLELLALVEVLKELVSKFPIVDDYPKNYQLLNLTITNFKKDNAEIIVLSYLIILIKLLGYDFRNDLNKEDDFDNLIFTLLSKKYKEIIGFDFNNIDKVKIIVYFLDILEKYSDTRIISKKLL